MTRPTIIAGNWKMHKTIQEAVAFVEASKKNLANATCEALIAPPFTALAAAASAAKGTNLKVGAQNMSDVDEGAFTGEISTKMLKEAGASFVILGHSERRSHFGEADVHISHKVTQALSRGIRPILCIGESAQDREEGRSNDVLFAQLDGSLAGIQEKDMKDLVIAYEPVWAIGTGKTATPEIAEETHKAIRAHLKSKWGDAVAERTPLLYGGSVKPENIESLLAQPDIDGALVGGAALDPTSFGKLIQAGSNT